MCPTCSEREEGWGDNDAGLAGVTSYFGPAEVKLGAALLIGGIKVLGEKAVVQGAKEVTRSLIKDATQNPGNWRTVGAFTEAATNKAAKGGVSVQRVVENEAGDQLVEHTVIDKTGKAVDGPHFRPNFKPRDVDQP